MTLPRAAGASRREVLGRIRAALRAGTYLVPSEHAPPEQRAALALVATALRDPATDPAALRTRIRQLSAAGRLDRPMALSALCVVAASPLVRDYPEALRLAGQQELAALDEGGPWLELHLASVARHRGVVFFLLGHDALALDWFARALERQRSAENVGNVLATLLRLGEAAEAADLLGRMRATLAPARWEELAAHVRADDDLVRLRDLL
jgi:hypothetical protein